MVNDRQAQWVKYSEAPEGEQMAEQFPNGHFWKPTHLFDSERIDISVIEMAPGEGGPRHSHEPPVEEFYMVLDGDVEIELDDEHVAGPEGMIFFFPPGTVHRPVNTTDTTARLLSFRVLAEGDQQIDID